MTRDSGFKQLVRERAQRTGESYSTARAHLRRSGAQADAELVTRCAAPIVRRLHTADPTIRDAVVPGLTRDQGELLAFWILYAHRADGLNSLCRTLPHRLVDPDFWILIETGLRHDARLVAIVARLRSAVEVALEAANADSEFEWLDLLDRDEIGQLDVEFEKAMPRSLHRMANHIRNHADRFAVGEGTAR